MRHRLALLVCLAATCVLVPFPATAQAPDTPCVRPLEAPAPPPTEDPLHRITRAEGVRVAVIDTGVAAHPHLGEVEPVADLVSPADPDPHLDCDGHGTVVAGVVREVAPGARILSIRQSSAHHREGGGSLASLAEAVHLALDAGAQVLNISVVSCVDPALLVDATVLHHALHRAEEEGAVVVAAAGNAGHGCAPGMSVYPAHLDTVLAVGAVDPADPHGQAGYVIPGADLTAPGYVAVGVSPGGHGWASGIMQHHGQESGFEGTSFAAPVVSGVVALLRDRHPHDSAAQLRARVHSAAEPGIGMVLPHRVLTSLGEGTPVAVREVGVEKQMPPADDAARRARAVMLGMLLLAWAGLLSARFRAEWRRASGSQGSRPSRRRR